MRNLILSVLLIAVFARPVRAGDEGDRILLENGKPVPYSLQEPERRIRIPAAPRIRKNEMRGVWVSTVWNLDFPASRDAKSFREAYRKMVKQVKEAGFTAVFFQVRPLNDAFYPSKLNPWSRYLFGQEGKAPDEKDFDPLDWMIRTTHQAGLEFHAWLNPFRISSGTAASVSEYLATLDRASFAVRKPKLVLAVPRKDGKKVLILNPGEPEVVLFLTDTIREILEKYPVDGIHFDDYFYPYEEMGNADEATYAKYAAKDVSLEEWRRDNVNRLILSAGKLIRAHNKSTGAKVRFGISPFGIWANLTGERPSSPEALEEWKKTPSSPLGSQTKGYRSLFEQYADTRRWVKNQWIDYIAPQIYWGFASSKSPYGALVDWWAETVRGTGVDLYIGIAVSRMGKAADSSRSEELMDQLKYDSVRPEVAGEIFFSWKNVSQPENDLMKKAVRSLIEGHWKGRTPFSR